MTAVTPEAHRLNYSRAILKGLQAKPVFQGVGIVKSREERLEDASKAYYLAKSSPVGHKARRKAGRAILRLSAKIARKATA